MLFDLPLLIRERVRLPGSPRLTFTRVAMRNGLENLMPETDRLAAAPELISGPYRKALRTRPAARFASLSFSKPNTAEYLGPTTCASTKLRLMLASAMALAIA